MTDSSIEDAGARRRRRRSVRKRKSRRREKLLYNLTWLVGGLAVGLPLVAIVIYLVSRL